jgi:hypothetical protein
VSDGQTIETEINAAIEEIIRTHEGGFTLKWVALVETVAPDGERGVWTMTSADVKSWDTLGLLEFGRQKQIAQILHGDD